MKSFSLTITHIKVLDTVLFLNKQNLYPLSDGIWKILTGVVDEETSSLQESPTFGTLTSFNSKKICRYILALHRHQYLRKVFDRETNELYYAVTQKGIIASEEFHKKSKSRFKRHYPVVKTTIVKID